MALDLEDIFPLSTTQGTAANAKILEPSSCSKELYMPTYNTLSESRLVYTKRISHPYYMFQYDYKTLMSWEYSLIEEFYRNTKGKYKTFYAVDWSTPYRISASSATTVTVDRVTGLSADTGFGGNRVLVYDPYKSGANKQILTIDPTEVFDDNTIAMNEGVNTSIATTRATLYVLYIAMFDIDKIKGTPLGVCIQKNVITFVGYGDKSLFGTVFDVTVPIIQMGGMK